MTATDPWTEPEAPPGWLGTERVAFGHGWSAAVHAVRPLYDAAVARAERAETDALLWREHLLRRAASSRDAVAQRGQP